MVYGLCLKILKQPSLAEEAAQDVFVKAYQKLASFKAHSTFKTWIYQITYRTAIDYFRKQKDIWAALPEDREHSAWIEPSADPQQIIERRESNEEMMLALQRLPAEQAVILQLYYLEEKNIKEVVQITGLTESNVKIKLYRARKALRKILEG